MFDTKDLDYVGGELGSAPRNQNHLSLLSTKLSSMVMQTDTEFQAKLGMQKTFDLKLNQLVLPDATRNFPNCLKIYSKMFYGVGEWFRSCTDGNKWKHLNFQDASRIILPDLCL